MDMSSIEMFLKTEVNEPLMSMGVVIALWTIGHWLVTRIFSPSHHGGAIADNGSMLGEPFHNYSVLPARRVERVAQLADSVDPADAVARLKAALRKIPNVLNTPAPEVSLLDLNGVGSVIAVRPYCHHEHYWQVYFDTHRAIVRVCKDAGWPAPTPTYFAKMVQLSAACA